jgi:hypothetical protein
VTEANVIRFEANQIEPDMLGEIGMLLVDSGTIGRVTIWMQRAVFERLFSQMQNVLEKRKINAPDPEP